MGAAHREVGIIIICGHGAFINAMMISAPRFSWMRIDISGLRRFSEPSIWDLKVTPSSSILRVLVNEKTWKPPESVRMGLSQCIKLCNPPISATSSSPGRKKRW
jgi:hypothetical protein